MWDGTPALKMDIGLLTTFLHGKREVQARPAVFGMTRKGGKLLTASPGSQDADPISLGKMNPISHNEWGDSLD